MCDLLHMRVSDLGHSHVFVTPAIAAPGVVIDAHKGDGGAVTDPEASKAEGFVADVTVVQSSDKFAAPLVAAPPTAPPTAELTKPDAVAGVKCQTIDRVTGRSINGVAQSLCCAAPNGGVSCFHAPESFIMGRPRQRFDSSTSCCTFAEATPRALSRSILQMVDLQPVSEFCCPWARWPGWGRACLRAA